MKRTETSGKIRKTNDRAINIRADPKVSGQPEIRPPAGVIAINTNQASKSFDSPAPLSPGTLGFIVYSLVNYFYNRTVYQSQSAGDYSSFVWTRGDDPLVIAVGFIVTRAGVDRKLARRTRRVAAGRN